MAAPTPAWIETMSQWRKLNAGSEARRSRPAYVITCSFDTAGRTMMGLYLDRWPTPWHLNLVAHWRSVQLRRRCIRHPGTLLQMQDAPYALVTKGNCGVPHLRGTRRYFGTPELIGQLRRLDIDAGARIIGGCCGTTPEQSRRNARLHRHPCARHSPPSIRSSNRSARSPCSAFGKHQKPPRAPR